MTRRSRARGWLAPAAAFALALPAVACAEAPAPAEVWRYRVAPDDTLIGLAGAYLDSNHDWRALQRLNRVPDPLRLMPGSSLNLPIAWLRKTATLAELKFVQGDVSVRDAATSPPHAVAAGDMLRAGCVIQTGPGGSATLRFADGSRLLVVGDSRVTIEQLLVYGRSQLPSIRLRLEQGGADSKVVPNTGRIRGYEVLTPNVNLGVRGTEFRARVADDGASSRVEVLEGRVGAASGRGETAVGAGFGAVAEQGRPVTAARPLMAAPDLATVAPRLERLPLRLAWPALPNASGYRAQVLAEGDEERLLLDGHFGEPAAKWGDLPDGRYRLRVRGVDAQSLEGIDAVTAFVLKARPEPPFTSQPTEGAKVYGPTTTFEWARSAAAASYHLQVSSSPDFSAPLIDRPSLTETRITLDLAPGVYHWRVASITAEGDAGPFGDTQSFAQREKPPDPAVEAPEPAPEGLTLHWRAPAPGEQVQFQVATDPAFEHIVVDQRSEAAQALVPRPAAGRYYLRARTIDTDGFAGDFGAVQQIEVPSSLSKWWLLVPAGALWLLL